MQAKKLNEVLMETAGQTRFSQPPTKKSKNLIFFAVLVDADGKFSQQNVPAAVTVVS